MTGHERAMMRARDYVLAQRAKDAEKDEPVDRRERYDVMEHLMRLQRSCDAATKKLDDDILKNKEQRVAVRLFGKRLRIIGIGFIVLFTTMIGAAFYLIDRNREAIEVGCLVVVQVVRDSGANSKPPDTPVGRAQTRVTTAFTTTLLEIMPPARRAAVERDQRFIVAAGGLIREPRCKRIANDPDQVRRETLQDP